ncbi:DUF835 domain-containing protein [Methanolobus sp. ZRKC3]|uniref:DUF835 domain-containing protein n=1 Tax=Methanolobus sp. ZRKC3 TaxID=3125786 RepID=UPI00324F8F57
MNGQKKGKVLVVDDELMNVRLLEAYLIRDYEVITASGGVEALEKVKAHDPDIILLDLMMPDITGYEVCRILKDSGETRFTPIIMVTALSTLDDRIKGINAGADDFLTKPLDRLEINTRVRSLLRIKKLHDDLVKEMDQAKMYLDMAAVVVLVLDEKGNVSLISKKGLEVLGYNKEEDIVGTNWFTNHVPESHRENASDRFRAFIAGNSTFDGYVESPVLTRDRKEKLIGWNNIVLLDEGEELRRILVSGTDITERKEAEEKIRRANEYLDNLMKASPISILSLDSEAKIVTANKTAAEMLGFDAGELVTKPISSLMESDVLPEFVDRVDFEMLFITADGQSIPMNVSTSVIEADDGSQGLIMVIQDMSKLQGLFITPLTEDIGDDSKINSVELESGFMYLSDEYDSLDSYNIFADLVKQGKPGLCITRKNPGNIRAHYGLSKTPLVWLTKNRDSSQQTIDSTELFKIHPTISDFIRKVDNGVVLVDGFEYLLLDNDFISLLKLIEQTNDTIMASNSRMILQIDPSTLEKKEFHLLKRWMKQLKASDTLS